MNANLKYSVTLDALYFTGVQAVAAPFLRGMGAILMLHRVCDAPHRAFAPNAHLAVSPAFLDRLLGVLSRRYDFVSLDEAATRLSAGERRSRPFLAITLDDGYRDNLLNAAPLFRKHRAPYTIFIAPGLVEGTATLWWEDLEHAVAARDRFVLRSPRGNVDFDVQTPELKHEAYGELVGMLTTRVDEAEQRRIVSELCRQVGVDQEAHRAASIMDWSEIAELGRDPLCSFGAHTMQHYAVARLDAKAAMHELVESRRVLELETGTAPRHFAFPYGYPAAAGPRDFELAREAGFVTAVTTRHGVIQPAHSAHMHALPRVSVNGHFQRVRYMSTLLSGLPARLANKGRAINVA